MCKRDHGPSHFKGKDAVSHVAETQAEGILTSAEIHGAETPGHIAAGADAARESAIVFLLLGLLFHRTDLPIFQEVTLLVSCALAWLVWKVGRSAWLGWQRLERLHRVIAEEKWEIEHHRDQEREELIALYGAKGFHGKLLEDVVDVLMADGDRLLRVMIEEELNLSLENMEHPLKQASGAGLGTIFAFIACLAPFAIFHVPGLVTGALVTMGFSGAITAHYSRNRRIPAITWSVGLGVLTFGTAYFVFQFLS